MIYFALGTWLSTCLSLLFCCCIFYCGMKMKQTTRWTSLNWSHKLLSAGNLVENHFYIFFYCFCFSNINCPWKLIKKIKFIASTIWWEILPFLWMDYEWDTIHQQENLLDKLEKNWQPSSNKFVSATYSKALWEIWLISWMFVNQKYDIFCIEN